jgi:hypothetical protein
MSPLKDNKKDASALKKNTSSIPETLKAFKIRFVRLNGILFTRTRYITMMYYRIGVFFFFLPGHLTFLPFVFPVWKLL